MVEAVTVMVLGKTVHARPGHLAGPLHPYEHVEGVKHIGGVTGWAHEY